MAGPDYYFDDFLTNPFEDSVGSGPVRTSSTYPLEQRQRGSEDDEHVRRRGLNSGRCYSYEDSNIEAPADVKDSHKREDPDQYHPLKPPPSSAGSRETEVATRPRLTRMLSDFEPNLAKENTEGVLDANLDELDAPGAADGAAVNQQEEEKLVIVHQISKSDSLAGVALKYGTTLAVLRKANHLWASDSIHLRKVLYIPVEDAAPKFRRYNERHSKFVGNGAASLSETPRGLSEGIKIRRVPVSEMKYFPSSSSPSALSRSSTSDSLLLFSPLTPSVSRSPKFDSVTISRRSKSTYPSLASGLSPTDSDLPLSRGSPTTSPGQTLTSLFNATRDTLDRIARASFESARSSTTTSAAGSDEQEHELDDIDITPDPRMISGRSFHSRVASAPPSHADASNPAFIDNSRTRSGWMYAAPQSTGGHLMPLEPTATSVRTAQMEPSPAMTLPPLRRSNSGSSKSHSIGAVSGGDEAAGCT